MPPTKARFSTLETTSTAATSLVVAGGMTAVKGAFSGGLAISGGTLSDAGIVIPTSVPSVTTMALYNNSGTLTWNGIALATGASLSGTTGAIAKFTASNAVGDSIITESGATITVTGTLNATTALQINGTSINTAGTLANVAYLNAANNFTNASGQTFAGGIGLSGGSPSTHGINIPSAVPGVLTTNLHNNGGALTWPTTLSWGGGSAISSSSNVALLNAANVFTANQAITAAASRLTITGETEAFVAFIDTTDGSAGAVGKSAGLVVGGGTDRLGLVGVDGIELSGNDGATIHASLSSAGLLTVSGAGGSNFSASHNAQQAITIGNATSGTAAESMIRVQTTGGTAVYGSLRAFSSGYASSGLAQAQSVLLFAEGTGTDLALAASDEIRFYTGATTLALTLGASQVVANNADLVVDATKKLYLDAGGNTYIYESSADAFSVVTGGVTNFSVGATYAWVAAGSLFYLDGGNDTYIYESSANTIRCVAGGSGGVDLTSGATAWAAVSDERQKVLTGKIENAAARLSKVRTSMGRYRSDDATRERSFFVAQDWQVALPCVVDTDPDGILSMRYTDTLPLIAAAVNEHTTEIGRLRARLDAAGL
jgi:hypothetical protein